MSLINVDFSGLSEPATKLIEKVSDAIGVLYEPRKIKKIAEAKSEVQKIELKTNLELTELEERAFKRTMRSEVRKQQNIDSITLKAAAEIKDHVQNNIEQLDEDWIVNFFKHCEDISDEQMQTLWSRVLSGESIKSGSFSKRTINFLSSLDRRDAELITSLGTTVWNREYNPLPLIFDFDNEALEKIGLNYAAIRHLESIGVITVGQLDFSIQFPQEIGMMDYYDNVVTVKINEPKIYNKFMPKEKNSIDVGKILLTNIGTELILICGSEPNEDYFHYALGKLMEEHEVYTSITFRS
ncbi:DUF2806 domain-containing protein [Kluyvera ascorbata]|uniref:DUF2806 domain-containing protein n=1 Tax=Kluyvera ascorbata TaxID=51288 RepID=UPI0035CD13C8